MVYISAPPGDMFDFLPYIDRGVHNLAPKSKKSNNYHVFSTYEPISLELPRTVTPGRWSISGPPWRLSKLFTLNGWIDDIKAYNNLPEFSYPIIADPKRNVAELYGMMDPDEKDAKGIIALTDR